MLRSAQLCAIGFALCSGAALAQPWGGYGNTYGSWEPQRSGRWEVALQARYQDYQTIRFNPQITLDPGTSWAPGFSVGYNFDPFLNVSFEVYGDRADYRGQVIDDTGSTYRVDGSLDNSSGQFNVTWHFLDRPVTPFVSAGLGWTYIDSHIIRNYAGVACWYHPWYGVVCGDVYNTYDDTAFSYNAAAGVRWDISGNFFTRASAGRQWIAMDSTSTHPSIDFVRLELGMMF